MKHTSVLMAVSLYGDHMYHVIACFCGAVGFPATSEDDSYNQPFLPQTTLKRWAYLCLLSTLIVPSKANKTDQIISSIPNLHASTCHSFRTHRNPSLNDPTARTPGQHAKALLLLANPADVLLGALHSRRQRGIESQRVES